MPETTIMIFSTVPKVLISTGYPRGPGKKTRVLNLEKSDEHCQDLADFPIATYFATGSNLTSIPIICGGTNSNSCFKYNNGWQHFATMKNQRFLAAGIVYDKGSFFKKKTMLFWI